LAAVEKKKRRSHSVPHPNAWKILRKGGDSGTGYIGGIKRRERGVFLTQATPTSIERSLLKNLCAMVQQNIKERKERKLCAIVDSPFRFSHRRMGGSEGGMVVS